MEFKMKWIYPDWFVREVESPTSCILALPGRAQYGRGLANWIPFDRLDNTLVIGVTPEKLEWYPLPNGAEDQTRAIDGLAAARASIEEVVEDIEDNYDIPRNKIALFGYSAGAVMAIEVASKSVTDFAGAVIQSGAILEPSLLPFRRNNTPYLVVHGQNDSTFSWQERVTPMVKSFQEKGYNYKTAIRSNGGHGVFWEDIIVSMEFLIDKLGYEKSLLKKIYEDSPMSTYGSSPLVYSKYEDCEPYEDKPYKHECEF